MFLEITRSALCLSILKNVCVCSALTFFSHILPQFSILTYNLYGFSVKQHAAPFRKERVICARAFAFFRNNNHLRFLKSYIPSIVVTYWNPASMSFVASCAVGLGWCVGCNPPFVFCGIRLIGLPAPFR